MDENTKLVQLCNIGDIFMEKNKKQAVIKMAQTLFTRFGLKKTTIDEIAHKSNVAKSTIYNYFRSKEDIYEEVIEKESRIFSDEINKAIKNVSDSFEKIRLYIITRMHHLKELVNLHSALTEVYLEHYSFIEKARRKSLEREVNTVKEILKDGVDKGVFSVKDLKLASFAIITAVKGLEYPWTVEVEMPEIQKGIDSLLEILFNGIRKR